MTTVADQTTAAVPALLSGRRSAREIRAPGLEAWPRNLFTLLDSQYRLDVREPVTRLCPAEACPAEARSTADAVGALASESSKLALLSVAPGDIAPRSPLIGGAGVHDPGQDIAEFTAGLRPSRAPEPALPARDGPAPAVGPAALGPGAAGGRRPRGARGRPPEPAPAARPRAVAPAVARAPAPGGLRRPAARAGARPAAARPACTTDALVVVAADHGVSFRPGAADARRDRGERGGRRARAAVREAARAAQGRGTDPAPAQLDRRAAHDPGLDRRRHPARGRRAARCCAAAPAARRPVRVLGHQRRRGDAPRCRRCCGPASATRWPCSGARSSARSRGATPARVPGSGC